MLPTMSRTKKFMLFVFVYVIRPILCSNTNGSDGTMLLEAPKTEHSLKEENEKLKMELRKKDNIISKQKSELCGIYKIMKSTNCDHVSAMITRYYETRYMSDNALSECIRDKEPFFNHKHMEFKGTLKHKRAVIQSLLRIHYGMDYDLRTTEIQPFRFNESHRTNISITFADLPTSKDDNLNNRDKWIWLLHTIKELYQVGQLYTEDLLHWGHILDRHCNQLRKPFMLIPYGIVLLKDRRDANSHTLGFRRKPTISNQTMDLLYSCMTLRVHQVRRHLEDTKAPRLLHPRMANWLINTPGTVFPFPVISLSSHTPDTNLSKILSQYTFITSKSTV